MPFFSKSLDLVLIYRMFWSRCDQLLRAHHVRPIIASTFFRDHLPGLTSWESHLITDYALAWLKQVYICQH